MEISLYKNNKLIKKYKAEDLEEDFNIILIIKYYYNL